MDIYCDTYGMSILEFVAAVIGAVAWPAAALALALILRPGLKHLAAGGVRRWKAGPVEIEYWDQEKAEVRESIQRSLPVGGEKDQVRLSGGLVDDLSDVAQSAPSAAVLEAFVRIEQELRRIASDAGLDLGTRPMSARQLARPLLEASLIRPESASAIEGLSVMRNLAAHGQTQNELDSARAVEYLYLADAVLFALQASPPPDVGIVLPT